ncbi:hypothetical protein PM082_013997 [Marasmius tenuissimus]|nr:hypothetical protein PM082_013997 [Marasmius tenuissimus]
MTSKCQTADFGTILYSCNRCGYIVDENASERVPQSSGLTDTFSKSNNPPSLSDLSPLETERVELTRILAVLVSQTARLRASTEILKDKKRQVEARLWTYKSAVHPIRRMPNELLAVIFGLCAEEDTRMQRKGPSGLVHGSLSMLNVKGCPWTLSQVCRRWRGLVFSLSNLWTVISVNWHGDFGMESIQSTSVEKCLSLVLERSGDRPLTVSWDEDFCNSQEVMFLLGSICSRWKDVTIVAGIEGLQRLALHNPSFSALSSLRLHFSADNWLEEASYFPSFRMHLAYAMLSSLGTVISWPASAHNSLGIESSTLP